MNIGSVRKLQSFGRLRGRRSACTAVILHLKVSIPFCSLLFKVQMNAVWESSCGVHLYILNGGIFMPLKNGTICTHCGKLMTKHPSGICSQCRRLSCTKPCKICGETGRNLYDGVCTSCRTKAKTQRAKTFYPKAIEQVRQTLTLLELLDKGLSFGNAASISGMSKTAAYMRIKTVLPVSALDFSEVAADGK